jgi:hypothetical protein
VLFSKQWGRKKRLGEPIDCEGDFEDGTHWVVMAAAVRPKS